MCVNQSTCFGAFQGTVKDIQIYKNNNISGNQIWNFVLVENEENSVVNFVISSNTYFAFQDMITIGSTITGYYALNVPVPLIYPPQYQAYVVVVEPDSKSEQIKVDCFNNNLVSSDGTLKLNIGENTQILNKDGSPYQGSLEGKALVVHYNAATKSIPAITVPNKIIVL